MQYLEVRRQYAQTAKSFLSKNNMLANGFEVLHSARYVYFPLTIYPASNKNLAHFADSIGAEVRERAPGQKRSYRRPNYEEELKSILDPEERGELARGYDPFGSIAIIELSEKLKPKEADIGRALIRGSSTVTTVLAKSGPVKGVYRTRSVRYVAGEHTYIANYRENGCRFVFDVRKVFFSPRLSYERSRISKLVKNGENVAVPFAGIGPFAIEIAKSHPMSSVLAIELNPSAYRYMLKNIELNKVPNVKAYKGDFGKLASMHKGFADRVVMPMPKTSLDFIEAACIIAKSSATFHIYSFCYADGVDEAIEAIGKRFREEKRNFTLMGVRTVRPYSKEEIEIVVDAKAGVVRK
ncbi:MAG: class I SAM-dependent methyltransferase family protein [Candidatus Micrarchaeaceae archaeon]